MSICSLNFVHIAGNFRTKLLKFSLKQTQNHRLRWNTSIIYGGITTMKNAGIKKEATIFETASF